MAGARIVTSRVAILDLLDARVGLGEAVEAGSVAVRGSLDDVQRAHDTLLAYVHAAVRASTQPALLSELRAEPHERTHHDAGLLRTTSHRGGARGGIAGLTAAHELAERGFVVTVYEARPMNATDWEPSRQGPTRPSSSAASPPLSIRRWAHTTGAKLSCVRSRAEGASPDPRRAVAGEHGFRFFPAFYLHIWDLFQRTPVYQLTQTADGTACWTPTPRTVMDNVRRVITKGITVDGEPSLVFPSERPRSPAEFLGVLSQLGALGFTPSDVATFMSRLLRYLVTSPLRRAGELQNVSAYDFLVGHDSTTGMNQFSYSPRCDALCAKCQGSWSLSTRSGETHAPTCPRIFSSTSTWTAATTRPTACLTGLPPSRGSTIGTATSSHSASASSMVQPQASIRPPSTRVSRPTLDPEYR